MSGQRTVVKNAYVASRVSWVGVTASDRRFGRDFHLDGYCFGHGDRGARWIIENRLFMKVKRELVDTPPEMDFELTRSPSHIRTAFDILSFTKSCPIPVSIQPVYNRHRPVSLVPCHPGHFQIESRRCLEVFTIDDLVLFVRFTHGSRTSAAYSLSYLPAQISLFMTPAHLQPPI